eukprot:TRINITY_DN6424_c0_g1_i1.p2 TRINITY_DN6424_c0_g1~~TRINITY_DN6424_c0_g1_i1.p2  ORF type:complete len:363 (+),score=148.75 TRINITY_DN6424_c0_g1_i1:106-1089(+)
MLARGASLLAMLVCASAAMDQTSESYVANNPNIYNAPAYDMANVTFAVMFVCKQNSWCYRSQTGGVYNSFNRDRFRSIITASVNERAEELTEKEENRFKIDAFEQIVFDRLVESTDTQPSMINGQTYDGYWNVLARVTCVGVPEAIANDFESVIAIMFGDDYGYGDRATLLWDSVWVSTSAYFIDNQLEPYRGRGHKSQMLLIPLLLGLSSMLLIPGAVVFVMVSNQQTVREQEKLLEKEEQRLERLSREEAEKEAQVKSHMRAEEEEAERIRKVLQDELDFKNRELSLQDVQWAKGSEEKPRELQQSGVSGSMTDLAAQSIQYGQK